MAYLRCPRCGLTVQAIDKPAGELCLRCRMRHGSFVRLEPEAPRGTLAVPASQPGSH